FISYVTNSDSHSSLFFNNPSTTEIYTLSLHDALPILSKGKTYIQPSIAILLIDEMNEEDNEVAMKIESLTKREYEILIVIAEGLNNREIAERLFISEKTVKNHVSNIFRKLEVNDRIQAAIFAFKIKIKRI